MCTDDSCDSQTLKCASATNTAACDDGDKCTAGDLCTAGTCKAGAAKNCDDKNGCTADKCDADSGNCSTTNLANASPCDDGIACTASSACNNGLCTPTANCSSLNDHFECGSNAAGWQITIPPSPLVSVPRKVLWAVDKLPAVGSPEQQAAHQCTLNFNNDTNYCDAFQQGNESLCLQPAGVARSPLIDWSANFAGAGVLTFDAYLDLDPIGNTPTEIPRITIREAGTNVVLAVHQLPKNPADMKVWKAAMTINLTVGLGKKFYVEFDMAISANTYSAGNSGAGIFYDNVKVGLLFVGQPENCGDLIDNNGNGKTDCADPACAATFGCSATKLISDPIDCSTSAANWLFTATDASTTNKVSWGVDNAPALVAKTGTCTLNYNNGTNYDAKTNNASVANAGLATWGKAVNTTGMAMVVVSLWYYYNTESGPNTQFATWDNAVVQVSTDDFATCCNATVGCGNSCNTANTKTYPLAKPASEAGLKTWTPFNQDISASFANKANVKLRIRFDTGDALYNAFPGVFVDDVVVLGK